MLAAPAVLIAPLVPFRHVLTFSFHQTIMLVAIGEPAFAVTRPALQPQASAGAIL
jgi:hypothetical protein